MTVFTDDQQQRLNAKFDPKRWDGYMVFQHYTYSGLNLIEDVNALDPDLVIDVGCGHNRFKGHIKNLIGFDPQPFHDRLTIGYFKYKL